MDSKVTAEADINTTHMYVSYKNVEGKNKSAFTRLKKGEIFN